MKVGVPFNPYRVFQGAFAPYWLLEHRGISAGAKLCYIRLLGFAGKDARCYPSLETLGFSLGVSDRQARDYVKELERQGLIVIEQRGLRKTNVYLFVWTAELEHLISAVPDGSAGQEDIENDGPPGSPPDRNNCSGQDRNSGSPPDRNTRSALDRKYAAGPIGINSLGINSPESSSSSSATEVDGMKKTRTQSQSTKVQSEFAVESPAAFAETICRWAQERGIQRLRSDQRTGPPDKEHLQQWSNMLEGRGITEPDTILAMLDGARAAADRSGEWRNWSFLTLQIQLAAERQPERRTVPEAFQPECPVVAEDPACDWAIAKAKIRMQIGEIPFQNWFAHTRQIGRQGPQITIAVSDETSRFFLETEYGNPTRTVLGELDIHDIQWIVGEPACTGDNLVPQVVAQTALGVRARSQR